MRWNPRLSMMIGSLLVVFAALVSAYSVFTVPVGVNPGSLAVIPQTGEIVVANSGSNDVSIVDADTLRVSTVRAGLSPTVLAVDPTTGYTYVANSAQSVMTAIYGFGEGKKRKSFATGAGGFGVAVNSVTGRVYVVNNADGTVTMVDSRTDMTATIRVGQRPRGIGVNESTNRVYVANIWDSSVTVINGATNAVIATVPVTSWPYDVVVNPDTNRVYVGSGDATYVTVIDGATHGTVEVPAVWSPALLAINRVTNRIYAAGTQGDGGITVIDGANGTSSTIPTPAGSRGFLSLGAPVVNDLTNTVYVPDAASTNLLVIDGVTNHVAIRPLEFVPCAAAVDRFRNRVYVSHCSDSRLSVITE
jgi:YVTN family beta-propeller protein